MYALVTCFVMQECGRLRLKTASFNSCSVISGTVLLAGSDQVLMLNQTLLHASQEDSQPS